MIFSENYTKLDKGVFTTIRKNTNHYKVGKTYSMQVKGKIDFPATIIGVKMLKKADITEEIARTDADRSRQELVDMLEGWYGKEFDDYVLITLQKGIL
jgi:hypothetical protein